MKYKMKLGDFSCVVNKPSEIKFWIRNEIGNYDNKAIKAEEWCSGAGVEDTYDDDFIHIEVAD